MSEKAVETEPFVELSPELLIEDVQELLKEIERSNDKIDEYIENIDVLNQLFSRSCISSDLTHKLTLIKDDYVNLLNHKKEWLQTLMKGKVSYI